MTAHRRTFRTYLILSLCPAPAGARLAFADPDVEGGIFYVPLYFMAVCDEQRWEALESGGRRAIGEPSRVVMPCSWRVDVGVCVADEANLLGELAPGWEVDETDYRVIEARRAAATKAMPRDGQ